MTIVSLQGIWELNLEGIVLHLWKNTGIRLVIVEILSFELVVATLLVDHQCLVSLDYIHPSYCLKTPLWGMSIPWRFKAPNHPSFCASRGAATDTNERKSIHHCYPYSGLVECLDSIAIGDPNYQPPGHLRTWFGRRCVVMLERYKYGIGFVEWCWVHV